MNIWPLRFRELTDGRMFVGDDAGGMFLTDSNFVERYAEEQLSVRDQNFLRAHGHLFDEPGDLAHTAFTWRWSARQARNSQIRYVILVPTLRCNLSCTYCQVSRVSETTPGYDWTPEILSEVLQFLDQLETDEIKVEFQGGEPLLRLDLLVAVRDFCRGRFAKADFVVCTNLQKLGPAEIAFLAAEDTHTSTSVDGAIADHDRHRTQNLSMAEDFFANLTKISMVANGRVSALPTIDLDRPPDIDALLSAYDSIGQNSIFLRPVNYQGFARRSHNAAQDVDRWNKFHEQFVWTLIDRNFDDGSHFNEYYLTLCLKRMLAPGHDSHVDLRNPALLASDYLVIDQNGILFPTDEARMVSRIGLVDLSIGTASGGVMRDRVADLNGASLNHLDPDCVHCPFQPFCGTDPIDDLSRYSRLDMPKHHTWFCQRHLALFDLAARLLSSREDRVRHSLRLWLDLPDVPPGLIPIHYDPAAP